MKKWGVTLCAILLLSTVRAQNWCPPGATWTYEALHDNGGFIRMSYTGDTLIDGGIAQVIDLFSATQIAPGFGEPEYNYIPVARITKVEGYVVYVLQDEAWDTLYWFNASPGHGYTAAHQSCSPFLIQDDGIEMFDGIPLRWHSIGSIHRIYERMGYTWHIDLACPGDIILDPAALRCYSDNQISVQLRTEDCEAFVAIQDLPSERMFLLHPDPGSDQLTLAMWTGDHTIEILDALGRCVFRERVGGDHITIDTHHLPSGTYLVHLWTDHAQLPAQRWVKE